MGHGEEHVYNDPYNELDNLQQLNKNNMLGAAILIVLIITATIVTWKNTSDFHRNIDDWNDEHDLNNAK